NNHRGPPPTTLPNGDFGFIYEDNGEGNITAPPGYTLGHSDGPGTLRDFVGEPGVGLWLFTMVDNALPHTGVVNRLTLLIEPHNDTNGITATIAPNSWF